MADKLYFIQGIFFTSSREMVIGHDPQIGSRVALQPIIMRTMYAGVLSFPEEDHKNGLGCLLDQYGYSNLTDVKMEDETLRFEKKYEHRKDVIFYSFKKEDNLWLGSYSGLATGNGASRCIIQPTQEEFFSPKGLENFFRKN